MLGATMEHFMLYVDVRHSAVKDSDVHCLKFMLLVRNIFVFILHNVCMFINLIYRKIIVKLISRSIETQIYIR